METRGKVSDVFVDLVGDWCNLPTTILLKFVMYCLISIRKEFCLVLKIKFGKNKEGISCCWCLPMNLNHTLLSHGVEVLFLYLGRKEKRERRITSAQPKSKILTIGLFSFLFYVLTFILDFMVFVLCFNILNGDMQCITKMS